MPRVFIRRGHASRVLACFIAFEKRVGATHDTADAFLIEATGLIRFSSRCGLLSYLLHPAVLAPPFDLGMLPLHSPVGTE